MLIFRGRNEDLRLHRRVQLLLQRRKKHPYKWLDFKALSVALLKPYNIIEKIKYFTALVSSNPRDPDKLNRQKIFIKALKGYIPELEVFYGHFLSHPVKAPLANPSPPKYFEQVIKTEEKGSDVNLAVHLLFDASQDFYDCAMVISNDGDLAEAMRLVRHHFKKPIVLVNPGAFPPSNKLRKYADSFKTVRKWMLKSCQLPSPIPGTSIHKPAKWELSSPAVSPHP